jgi:PAS domain S-box-containing protein
LPASNRVISLEGKIGSKANSGKDYRQHVKERLDALSEIFAKAAVGDFSSNLEIPEEEDEFTELYAGIQIMLEVIREKTKELEDFNDDLERQVEERTRQLATKDKELAESEAQLRLIVENSSSLIYSHDVNHVLTYVSPQSERILDVSPAEAKRKWMTFLSDNPVNKLAFESTKRAIKTGKPQPPYEVELITPKGRKLWAQISEAPVVEDGKVVAVVGSLTDVTARKQAEQELHDRTEELEKFNKLMIGRELKMIELKEEVARLRKELARG